MGIRSVSKRARYGDRLIQLESEGTRAIQGLQGLTQTLPELRQDIIDDADLDQAEETAAIAEVDATIADLVTQVKDFAGSL